RGGSMLALACSALPRSIHKRLANRRLDAIEPRRLGLHPLPELASLYRTWREGALSQSILYERNKRFQSAIPSRAIENADVVIGFDTSSWILAERCREAGVPFVLDQSACHPNSRIAAYNSIRDAFPQWASDVHIRLPEMLRAEQIEHDLADVVVAASSFTIRTLVENGVAAHKIFLNAYGVDIDRFLIKPLHGERPLRFVFLGAISAQKGVPLLVEAWRRLGPRSAQLWLVGPVEDRVRRLIPALPGLQIVGPVVHSEVPRILQQCDVLVFPSYFEGFGLVILEAMACGLPVVATNATIAPDLFEDGSGGWIIPVGDIGALADRLESCLRNPHGAREMGQVARRIAERHVWENYGDRWVQVLDRFQHAGALRT
ncbi:MAG: glycosyltransferase family 4 protein, partial [Methylocystis sp.]